MNLPQLLIKLLKYEKLVLVRNRALFNYHILHNRLQYFCTKPSKCVTFVITCYCVYVSVILLRLFFSSTTENHKVS